MINIDNSTLTPSSALQQSLNDFSTSASDVIKSTTPNKQTNDKLATQTLESSFIEFKKSEQNSLANLKVFKTDDQLIGKLLDIMA